MTKALPKISIVIPTYNEEKNIESCLSSIFQQEYPKSKLEVIVVDDSSEDKTLIEAKKFPVKIIKHRSKHGEIGKMIGMRKAKGEYVMYLDADIELRGKKWLNKMILPHLEENIIGSFTRYYSKNNTPSIERYLNFDPLQRDSIYKYFSPSIETTVVQSNKNYAVCEYKLNKIPPAGLCLYKRRDIEFLFKKYKMFLELDFLVLLVHKGHNKFAYVPNAGLYHHHVTNLKELLLKRKYNLTKVYLAREKRLYKWFDLTNPIDLIKIIIWIVYANLLIPSIIVGLAKSIKYKDWAGMYEPIINILVTDILIFNFLISRQKSKLLLT